MPQSSPSWLDNLRGQFIVFDGPDGSGKSTQFRRFHDYATAGGLEVCEVREPGGTIIGEQVRQILLDPANDPMDLRCEMLLYMASRAQLIAERIRPALDEGKLVLADRFISSTLAYQGTAGGLNVDDIDRVGLIALGRSWPNLVVIFDVDEKTAATRLNPLLDRMEQKGQDFHRTVRRGFLDHAQADPDHCAVIDARADADTVFARLLQLLEMKAETL